MSKLAAVRSALREIGVSIHTRNYPEIRLWITHHVDFGVRYTDGLSDEIFRVGVELATEYKASLRRQAVELERLIDRAVKTHLEAQNLAALERMKEDNK